MQYCSVLYGMAKLFHWRWGLNMEYVRWWCVFGMAGRCWSECAYVICLFGFSNIRPNKFDEIISYRTRWLVMRMNWFLSRRVDIGLPYFPIAKSMERPRVVAKWFGCMKYCENINDIQFIVRLKCVIAHASGAKTPEHVNDVLLRRQNRRK